MDVSQTALPSEVPTAPGGRATVPTSGRSERGRWSARGGLCRAWVRSLGLGWALWATVGCDHPPEGPVFAHTPSFASPSGDYGSSGSCRSCHPDAWDSWSQTFHRTMTQRATPEAVLADWEGVRLDRNGREYVLYREGDTFFVDMPRPGTRGETDRERMQRPVVMTTGSHHLQLYWITMPWLEEAPDPTGATLLQVHCGECHALEGEELAEDDPRTWLQNRKIPRPVLQSMLANPDPTGPHGAVFAALRPSELPPLLDHLERLQHGDRLAQFPFAWFIRQSRWVHEDDSFLSPPDAPSSHETMTEGWSDGCDRCHSVGPQFSTDPVLETGSAEVVDLGIACEACHGPGAAHAARYRSPLLRYAAHLGMEIEDDMVVPSELPADRSSQVCGQCHAELVPKDGDAYPLNFRPGDDLADVAHFVQRTEERPDWLVEHLEDEPDAIESGFWRDGTMRIAGRDYSALRETRCHTAGALSCTSCHQLHGSDPNDQLKPTATGDSPAGEAVCVDCHPGSDSTSHHHHPVESSGARCMNCHMPHTTIGLLTVMRSHRVDSPSPSVAAETGRPDACSLCHLDKPLAWSAGFATEWWGQPSLPGAVSTPAPASFSWLLRGDAAQRAVVAWHLGAEHTVTGQEWAPVLLAWSLDDPYVAVRSIVHERVRSLHGYEDMDWDPTRSPEALAEVRTALLERWAARNPGLHRPELWIHHGVPDTTRLETWRMLRDETPVSVNE